MSVPMRTSAPMGARNSLTPPIPIIITENTDPTTHSNIIYAPSGAPVPLPISSPTNPTRPRSPVQRLSNESLQNLPQLQTLEALRQSTLASFPVPAGYPPTTLQPISLPATLNLHAFLDQATGVCTLVTCYRISRTPPLLMKFSICEWASVS